MYNVPLEQNPKPKQASRAGPGGTALVVYVHCPPALLCSKSLCAPARCPLPARCPRFPSFISPLPCLVASMSLSAERDRSPASVRFAIYFRMICIVHSVCLPACLPVCGSVRASLRCPVELLPTRLSTSPDGRTGRTGPDESRRTCTSPPAFPTPPPMLPTPLHPADADAGAASGLISPAPFPRSGKIHTRAKQGSADACEDLQLCKGASDRSVGRSHGRGEWRTPHRWAGMAWRRRGRQGVAAQRVPRAAGRHLVGSHFSSLQFVFTPALTLGLHFWALLRRLMMPFGEIGSGFQLSLSLVMSVRRAVADLESHARRGRNGKAGGSSLQSGGYWVSPARMEDEGRDRARRGQRTREDRSGRGLLLRKMSCQSSRLSSSLLLVRAPCRYEVPRGSP